MSYPSRPFVTIAKAKKLTNLDLVSARNIRSNDGQSYHKMEQKSESSSHESAKKEGIKYFCSIGYHVFPEGIGVKNTYTLADFLALRANRTVFVEVLSDANIKDDTLRKKSQLQKHGELCFILFSGTKRSDEPRLLAAKHRIESWADVLYCDLHGYRGDSIRYTYNSTVAYDTTREQGIKVALSFRKSGQRIIVSVKFLTHLYKNPFNSVISYIVLPVSYCYETIFLDLFRRFERLAGWKIKYRSHKENVTVRSMRRNSGLKMIGPDGHVAARLRSEYRGIPPIEEPNRWTYHPSSRDLPPDDFYGVFTLEKTGSEGLRNLFRAMNEYGLTLQYNADEVKNVLRGMRTQTVVERFPVRAMLPELKEKLAKGRRHRTR